MQAGEGVAVEVAAVLSSAGRGGGRAGLTSLAGEVAGRGRPNGSQAGLTGGSSTVASGSSLASGAVTSNTPAFTSRVSGRPSTFVAASQPRRDTDSGATVPSSGPVAGLHKAAIPGKGGPSRASPNPTPSAVPSTAAAAAPAGPPQFEAVEREPGGASGSAPGPSQGNQPTADRNMQPVSGLTAAVQRQTPGSPPPSALVSRPLLKHGMPFSSSLLLLPLPFSDRRTTTPSGADPLGPGPLCHNLSVWRAWPLEGCG